MWTLEVYSNIKSRHFPYRVLVYFDELAEAHRSSSVCGSHRLGNTRNLVVGTDDALAGGIGDDGDILVLRRGALPDLNLAATTDDTNAHRGEQVVSSVRVVVDTTVEDSSGILADSGVDQGLATGVVGDELADIMDDTSDNNPGLAVLRLSDEVVPADNGQVLQRNTPVESGSLLVELLLNLLETALLDLVVGELLQVVGEAELLPDPDAPLGGIILPPLNGVTEIAGELVVEVVVTLTKGDKGGDDVISR